MDVIIYTLHINVGYSLYDFQLFPCGLLRCNVKAQLQVDSLFFSLCLHDDVAERHGNQVFCVDKDDGHNHGGHIGQSFCHG